MNFKDTIHDYVHCHRSIDNVSQRFIRSNWVNIIKRNKEFRKFYIHQLCESVIQNIGRAIILGNEDIRVLHKYKEEAFKTMSIMWFILKEVPRTRADYDTAVDWEFGTAKSKRKEFKENVWDQVSDALLNEEFWSDDDVANCSSKELLLNKDMKKEIIDLFENMPDAEIPEELMHRFWKFYKDTECYSKHYCREELFWYV